MSGMKSANLLSTLQDAALADLEQTSDEDLLKEALDEGEDVETLMAAFRSRIEGKLDATRKAHERTTQAVTHSLSVPDSAAVDPANVNRRIEASSMLVQLQDSCRARHWSYLTFDSELPKTTLRFEESLASVERLLGTYISESQELADLFPGSRVSMLHALLHEAIRDEQISRFVHISLGTLASTLCTLALGKASGFDFDATQTAGERNRLLRKIRSRKEWHAFRNLIVHQPELIADMLDAPRAVNGLAAMQSALEDYQPDAIVAVEGGGEIVASFLRAQIGLESRRYFIANRKRDEYVLDRDLIQSGHVKRVVVVDDVSRTGRTLASICNQTFGGMVSIEFKVLTLVSAAAATAPLRDRFLVLPVVSHSTNVSVPWDNKGSYKTTRTNYVFGADRRSPLKVPKSFYERIYSDLTP